MKKLSIRWIVVGIAAILLSYGVISLIVQRNTLEDRVDELADRLLEEKEENQELRRQLAETKEILGAQSSLTPSQEEGHKAYLTFDDGPHENTDKVLDILNSYHIKATFFVNGKESDEDLATYKRIVDEGHTLGNHTYSHEYKEIYASVDAFMSDVKKLEHMLQERAGITMPKIVRMPGGSNNTLATAAMLQDIKSELEAQGYKIFDWNVSGEDAIRKGVTADEIYNQVLETTKGKDDVVILLHSAAIADGTVEALPRILDYYLEQGYVFHTLDEQNTPEVVFAARTE